jgi:hypothetical protein
MNNYVKEQKILSRKNIVKYTKRLKKAEIKDKTTIIKAIASEKRILDFKVDQNSIDKFSELVYNVRQAEMAIELPGAPAENKSISPVSKLNFGQFINILEQDVAQEEQVLSSKSNPTQNDLIRWARKWAFLQYYKAINISPEQPITKTDGDDTTLRQLAPNKDTIYKLYLDKLEELKRRTDKYQLLNDKFDNALYNGTPQGGSFEKWLERYREEIMNKSYANR